MAYEDLTMSKIIAQLSLSYSLNSFLKVPDNLGPHHAELKLERDDDKSLTFGRCFVYCLLYASVTCKVPKHRLQ